MELLFKDKSDLVGITASGLCAIHCAATPFLFAITPFFGKAMTGSSHSHGPWYWHALDFIFLLSGLIAVWLSSRCQSNKTIKVFLWTTWILLAIGLIMEHYHVSPGNFIMYTGSLGLIVAHVFNFRYKIHNHDASEK